MCSRNVGLSGRRVDDDVEDCAPCAPHELGFGRWRELEVHPAQRALLVVEGQVGLRDHGLKTVIDELLLTKRAGEEPAGVPPGLDVDDECAGQARSP